MRKCKHLLCTVLVSSSNRSHDYLTLHKQHVECYSVYGKSGACPACTHMAGKLAQKEEAHAAAAAAAAGVAMQGTVLAGTGTGAGMLPVVVAHPFFHGPLQAQALGPAALPKAGHVQLQLLGFGGEPLLPVPDAQQLLSALFKTS
jgi:hypothetical protein